MDVKTIDVDNPKNEKELEVATRIDPIDVIVGEKISIRRRLLGLSQQDVAKASGVSIQQIQKYEKAINRVSSSRLYHFAKILKIASIDYFFPKVQEEINTPLTFAEGDESFDYDVDSSIKEKEVLSLVKEFSRIKDHNVRRLFLELIKSVATINYVKNI